MIVIYIQYIYIYIRTVYVYSKVKPTELPSLDLDLHTSDTKNIGPLDMKRCSKAGNKPSVELDSPPVFADRLTAAK